MAHHVVRKLTKALSHTDMDVVSNTTDQGIFRERKGNNNWEEEKHNTKRPEISRNASAHREVESAIILTL